MATDAARNKKASRNGAALVQLVSRVVAVLKDRRGENVAVVKLLAMRPEDLETICVFNVLINSIKYTYR